jgi:Na+/citrate or Na+/malate symporter
MTESLTSSKKLQWKWVGITLLLYVVFYPSPIFIANYILAQKVAEFFTGAWTFAGIIIIGAVAGYLSKEVTIWEPAIAGASLIALCFTALTILMPRRPQILHAIVPLIIMMAIVFLLSLLGAWLGERAQKLWKTKSPKSI